MGLGYNIYMDMWGACVLPNHPSDHAAKCFITLLVILLLLDYARKKMLDDQLFHA